MAKTLQEVLAAAAAHKEDIPVDYENIPEELGAFRQLPQPQALRFKIPDVIDSVFDTIEIDVKDAEGKPTGAKKLRVVLDFSRDKALVIEQSKDGLHNGEDFSTRISGAERNRFAGKGQTIPVSDLTYLLRAIAPTEHPKTLQEVIQTCLNALPGKTFGADLEWAGFCNPKKDAFFEIASSDDPAAPMLYEPVRIEGGTTNHQGCGNRVYQKDWPKVNGIYSERARCKCNAMLRPFGQLVRFRP